MRTSALSLIALALLTSACGKQGQDAVNQKFDENFRASCVGSATKSGAPATLATQICDCTLAEINKKYGATEKLTLSTQQAEPMMRECVNRTVKK